MIRPRASNRRTRHLALEIEMPDNQRFLHQHDRYAVPDRVSHRAILPHQRAVQRRIGVLPAHRAHRALADGLDESLDFGGTCLTDFLMGRGTNQKGK